jgi:hypothetical protein
METDQLDLLLIVFDKHHDHRLLLMLLLEDVLFHMYLVVDKANEVVVLWQLNGPHRHILSHVHNSNLVVGGHAILVCQQGVLNDEGLRRWLRILECNFGLLCDIFRLIFLCCEELDLQRVCERVRVQG